MKRITPLRRQVCGLILSGLGWFGLLLLTDLIQVRQSGGLMAEAAELTVPRGRTRHQL